MPQRDRTRMPKTMTIADVARRAGVSTATAGRVLGGYGYSSEAVRKKVQKAAQDLGYRPNHLARSLIRGETRTIGVVIGDIQSPFYARIIRGISDVVQSADLGLIISNSDETVEHERRSVDMLMDKKVDGMIVSPADTVKATHLHAVREAGVPLLLIDRRVQGLEVDSITLDNVGSARAGVADLLAAGHRRIAVVGELGGTGGMTMERILSASPPGPPDIHVHYPSWQRLLGYLLAHHDVGLAPATNLICQVGSYSSRAAAEKVEVLLRSDAPPTAIFTADGVMSAGTMAAIKEVGLRIPEDVSLLCFDDMDWMEFLTPGIDAISQPRTQMGQMAARMLLEQIADRSTAPRVLEMAPRYIRRGSIREMPGSVRPAP